MEELEALLILNSLPYAGSIKIRLIIDHFGSALNALQAPLAEIGGFPGFGPKTIGAWEASLREKGWEKDWCLADQLESDLSLHFSFLP